MKVSACIITYNQENYIRECLEGAIKQNLNCSYEIVIGEDCSTDKTLSICYEYALMYPHLIRILPKENNLGMISNWKRTISNCTGEFIAICEGDDYWTDPNKLQKQVDFLEANEDYVLCFHKVDILKEDGTIVSDFITNLPENFQNREVLLKNSNYIHTPSVLFRSVNLNFPDLFKLSPYGDYILYILLSKYGKIGYLEDCMGTYRYNVGLLSKSENNHFKDGILLNLVALKIVDDEKEVKILMDKILELVLNKYANLPFSILLKTLWKLPLRFFNNYIWKYFTISVFF